MVKRGRKRASSSWIQRRRSKRAKPTSKYFRSAIKRTVNRLTETKCKWLEINEVDVTTSTGAKFYDPMQVVRGDSRDQRDGNEIRPSGLHIKGYFHNNGDETDFVRLVVFKAKTQANFGTAIDCFETNAGDAQAPADINGAKLIYYPLAKSKMSILKDKVFKLGPKTNQSNGHHVRHFNIWIPLKGKLLYEGNTNGADNVFPRYHIAVFHAEADEEQISETVELNFLSRFYFKDM